MAFNPFDLFRRNQKILMAGITVIIMFLFVLTFGQGDIISRAPQWLASRQRTGEVIGTANGTKVYGSELADIRAGRLSANQYMDAAARRAVLGFQKLASDTMPRVSAPSKLTLEQVQRSIQSEFLSQKMEQNFRFAQQLPGMVPMPSKEELFADREQSISIALTGLAQVLTAKDQPAADLEAASALQRAIDLKQRTDLSGGQAAPLYFTNQPNATDRDALEFYLWLKKADQLGIAYTEGDVEALANQEFGGVLGDDDRKVATAAVQGRLRTKRADFLAALGDEFRVRAAQGAVLGQAYLRPQAVQFDAPADFYEFYRKQCAAAKFAVTALPAEAFVSQVQGAPDGQALQDIFAAGKNLDPAPGQAKLGLREPRRIKLAYVEVKADEPFYKSASEEAARSLDIVAKVGGLLAPSLGGLDRITQLAGAPRLVLPDPRLTSAYAEYTNKHTQQVRTQWYSAFSPREQLLDTSLVRPAPLAGLVAAAGGHPLVAALTFVGEGAVAERVARFNTLPPAFVAPALPGAGGFAALIAAVAPHAAAAQPLPLSAVQGQLAEQARAGLTKILATRDLERLTKDLTALNAKKDDPAPQKLVDEFVKARGLAVVSSQEPRDLYGLKDDAGLRPLFDRLGERLREAPQVGPNPSASFVAEALGGEFFFEINPLTRARAPSVGLFKPKPVPVSREEFPKAVAWRTQDIPAEAPKSLNGPGVREKVTSAWRLMQARKVAEKAAQDLAAKCQSLGKGAGEIDAGLVAARKAALAGLPADAQARVRAFDIDDVAPITKQVLPTSSGQGAVGEFSLRRDANTPFPTTEMVTALLNAKDSPPSTTVVMADAPRDTFYVATLVYRKEADPGTFASLVYGEQARGSQLAPPVRRAHQEALRKQMRDDAALLLRSEFGYSGDDAKLDARRRGDAGES